MENQFSHENDDSCGVVFVSSWIWSRGLFGMWTYAPGKMGSMAPFEMVMVMWHKASFEAYSELMVEKLKKRIEAANGPVMDKVADALTESMGKEWQAMI